jgi:outer membrane protein insertion porin family
MRNGSTKLVGKFVLMSQVRFGFLGQYNHEVGPSPFERFKLGGDGMQSYQFLQGSEIIGLRGLPKLLYSTFR